MKEIKFTVRGEPYGKGRPRFAPNGHAYTPEKTADYERLVQLEYATQVRGKDKNIPEGVCLVIKVYAYYPIPKNTPKWKIPYMLDGTIRPLNKPDWDNIAKIIADSLNGVAYHDDAQIVDGMVRKFYSDKPRVEVTISEAECFTAKITQKELESILNAKKERSKK